MRLKTLVVFDSPIIERALISILSRLDSREWVPVNCYGSFYGFPSNAVGVIDGFQPKWKITNTKFKNALDRASVSCTDIIIACSMDLRGRALAYYLRSYLRKKVKVSIRVIRTDNLTVGYCLEQLGSDSSFIDKDAARIYGFIRSFYRIFSWKVSSLLSEAILPNTYVDKVELYLMSLVAKIPYTHSTDVLVSCGDSPLMLTFRTDHYVDTSVVSVSREDSSVFIEPPLEITLKMIIEYFLDSSIKDVTFALNSLYEEGLISYPFSDRIDVLSHSLPNDSSLKSDILRYLLFSYSASDSSECIESTFTLSANGAKLTTSRIFPKSGFMLSLPLALDYETFNGDCNVVDAVCVPTRSLPISAINSIIISLPLSPSMYDYYAYLLYKELDSNNRLSGYKSYVIAFICNNIKILVSKKYVVGFLNRLDKQLRNDDLDELSLVDRYWMPILDELDMLNVESFGDDKEGVYTDSKCPSCSKRLRIQLSRDSVFLTCKNKKCSEKGIPVPAYFNSTLQLCVEETYGEGNNESNES